MEGLKIVLFAIALAVVYGLVHDQVTIRVCLEYFTIGHPYLVPTTSPTLIALAWGVVATWWMGLILGLILWPAMRGGSKPKLTWRALVVPGLLLLVVMGLCATAAGFVGRHLAESGRVFLVGRWAQEVPADRHVDFLTALWAHNASYLVGGLGGVALAILLRLRRGRLVKQAAVAAALALAAGWLAACHTQETRIELGLDGKGTFTQTVTLHVKERDALLRRLAVLYGAEAPPEVLPFADPFHPRWVETEARGVKGVELQRIARTSTDGRRITRIEATFSSLDEAARAGLLYPAGMRLERFVPELGVDSRWRLTLTDPWTEPASKEDGTLGGRPFAKILETARSSLGALELVRVLRLPTRVVSTTGELGADGRTVTWRITTADLEARKNLSLVVVFENTGDVQLTSFRHRPDPEAVMKRALEAPPGAVLPRAK